MLRRSSRHVKNVEFEDRESDEDDNESIEREDWESDDNEDHEKSSEDEGSDYDGSKRRDVNKFPVKKKAKTTQLAASKNARGRRRSLSMLPSLPLDVLFEIFSHLSPKDVMSLSRTSKAFHETLSSKNATSVWKAARERISAPDVPDWMSETAWADLLFGHNCQSCGTTHVHKVDFRLLKRICVSCKKRHYVVRSKVEKRYPDADFVILDLIPSTNLSAWSSWARSSYYYWDNDLGSMVKKLSALRANSNAQQLNNFMDERKRRVQYIDQNSSSWQIWYDRMQRDRSQHIKEAETKRLHQIEEKFKELGYIEEDLYGLSSHKECQGKAQLTDKIWNRIRPILEPDVQTRKAQRLERQFATIKCHRRRILATRYTEFKRTLLPSQWKYLPRTLEITAFEPFARHIEADVGVEIDATTFDDAFLRLPNLLSTATEQRKAALRVLMGGVPMEDGEIDPVVDPLGLATAVFQCTDTHIHPSVFGYVFGWDEIASHHCLPEGEGNGLGLYISPESRLRTAPVEIDYKPEAAKVIKKLAVVLGLDAATATVADLDKKNLRFGCGTCAWFKESGQYYKFGYSWRSLATHLETFAHHNANFDISILSENEAIEVRRCENDRKWNTNQWTCAHCPEYLENSQARRTIIEHLSDTHGIQTPSEPTDLFLFERHNRDWSSKSKFSIPPPADARQIQNLKNDVTGRYRCLVCPSNTRTFVLNGVKDHLRSKHGIPVAQDGMHHAPA